MDFKDLIGKTIVHAKHIDNDCYGIALVFDDGTKLTVTERSQSGQMEVCINDDYCGEGSDYV